MGGCVGGWVVGGRVPGWHANACNMRMHAHGWIFVDGHAWACTGIHMHAKARICMLLCMHPRGWGWTIHWGKGLRPQK